MDARRWDRLAAATGIVFVVLQVATVFAQGDSPDLDDPVREIREFLVDDGGRILAAAMLNAFSAFFFLWFLGSVRSYLRAGDDQGGRLTSIAFGAGLVTIALAVAASMPIAGLAWDDAAARADAGLIRVGWNLSFLAFIPIGASAAAFTLAIAVIGLRSRLLPAWLAWLGVVATVAGLLSVFALITDDPESVLGFLGFVSFVLSMIFILALSIVMVSRIGGVRSIDDPRIEGAEPRAGRAP